MDHDTVIETLEIAAAEPGGLDRLMAGDTPAAMAVAGHLAGCPSCTLELDRLQRASVVLHETIGSTPSPELRDRTLAYVRSHGIPRGSATAVEPTAAVAVAPPPITSAGDHTGRRAVIGWVAAVAAAVVISVVATTLLIGSRVDDRFAAQDQAIEDLAAVTTATLHVTAEPDVARVSLDSPSGEPTTGTLLYSPSSTELVVVATGLTEPEAGKEYRCWVVVDGERQAVGKMFFGGGLAYWVGPSPAVAGLDDGATFGVSLVDDTGSTVGPDPVLTSGA
jgi:hypothetical protein